MGTGLGRCVHAFGGKRGQAGIRSGKQWAGMELDEWQQQVLDMQIGMPH